MDIWEWVPVEIDVFGATFGDNWGSASMESLCSIKYFFVVIIFLFWIATPAFGAAKPRGFASSNLIKLSEHLLTREW